ncbi:hypothetical protein BAE44_0001678 [Dichanthelium oligosanthes]|uniref:Transcription repressor n=1 Tax=Dichanthelium oligosanthes TaxID=888268 RepID=A0A1E5WIS5_9POAL|nr:hypothetical protein BAE44_0001678 [Dichanthelium oligosanthes]
MSPGAGAKKRLGVAGVVGGGGGFGLGDRTGPHHPSSASGSTGTLTVPSASSSSFVWEDADDGDAGEEVDCKLRRESSAAAASFSGLLRQLNELEQSVVTWGRKSTSKGHFSPPPPPPPPPPLPARPVKQRVAHSGGGDSKEGHGNFSPTLPPPPSFQLQTTQQHRKSKNMDKADRQAEEVHSKQPPPPPPPPPLPLLPEQPLKVKSTDKGGKKEDASTLPTSQAAPKHRKAKSCDGGTGAVRLDGTVAVVKQSDDPLSDFRRSMVNMIVENRIATADELRELLRHFLALNAPHHHDAILRAFTEIWDEAFSAKTTLHREPAVARPTPPRARPKAPTPPRRRHAPPPRVWR